MMFGNYLKILKLVFIWTNLSLKLVIKKKLNWFYFIPTFSPSILSLFITFFSLLTNPLFLHWPCQPSTTAAAVATIRHRLPLLATNCCHHPPLSAATVYPWPLSAAIRHHRPWLSTAIVPFRQLPLFDVVHRCLPPPSIATHHPRPPPATAIDCYLLPLFIAAIRYHYPLPPPATVCLHYPPSSTTVCHRQSPLATTVH